MKVEQNKSNFKPMVITLESQDDIDQLAALTSFIYPNGSKFLAMDTLHNALMVKISPKVQKYFIMMKKRIDRDE